jgi:insertion element IS1 protein InsB
VGRAQKYHCQQCGSYGTSQARQGYSAQTRAQVQRAVLERVSLRGIVRFFDPSRRTVAGWIPQWIAHLPPLESTLMTAHVDDVLELDELWSFVLNKDNQRWVWVASCRRTRPIVAYYIGDHSQASCLRLWRRIPRAYTRCYSFSDCWAAYQAIFDRSRHQSVGKDSGETNHLERWRADHALRLGR